MVSRHSIPLLCSNVRCSTFISFVYSMFSMQRFTLSSLKHYFIDLLCVLDFSSLFSLHNKCEIPVPTNLWSELRWWIWVKASQLILSNFRRETSGWIRLESRAILMIMINVACLIDWQKLVGKEYHVVVVAVVIILIIITINSRNLNASR